MASYRWNENTIEKYAPSNTIKKVLNNEYSGIKDTTSYAKYYDLSSFNAFLKQYRSEYAEIKENCPELSKYIDELDVNFVNKTGRTSLKLKNELSPSNLLDILNSFIDDLNDYDIKDEFYSIVNSNKSLLNIQKSTFENRKTRGYEARCIESGASLDTYISLYIENEVQDYTNLAHEFGHAFEHRLFFNKQGYLIKYFLTEVSSYYFQLLMSNYLNNFYPGSEDLLIFDDIISLDLKIISNKMAANIYENNRIKMSDLRKIYKNNVVYSSDVNLLSRFLIESYRKSTSYISSYMIALNLYLETILDKEAGLEHYKDLIIDSDTDLIKFLNRHYVNFIEDNASFEEVKAKSLNAYNKVKKK